MRNSLIWHAIQLDKNQLKKSSNWKVLFECISRFLSLMQIEGILSVHQAIFFMATSLAAPEMHRSWKALVPYFRCSSAESQIGADYHFWPGPSYLLFPWIFCFARLLLLLGYFISANRPLSFSRSRRHNFLDAFCDCTLDWRKWAASSAQKNR